MVDYGSACEPFLVDHDLTVMMKLSCRGREGLSAIGLTFGKSNHMDKLHCIM